MNYLTHKGGKNVSAQLPLPVDDVTQASDRFTPAAETVTFNSAAAAGSTGVNALDKSPILNLVGDKVGSYWGENRNKVMEFTNTGNIGTLTETAASASVIITDGTNNLETLFEVTSGNRRYILRAIDDSGDVLYGWIGSITVSGSDYTIPVHNAVTGGAQSWVGSLANFDNTKVRRIEIYSYESSFTWTTGTVLTEEVAFDPEIRSDASKLKEFYDSLSNGQYGMDYQKGAIYFKKATTGTSDSVNYTTRGSISVTVSGSGGSSTLVDDAAFTVASSDVTPVGFLADETATDSVDEGDTGAARMTLNRRQIMAHNFLDDAAFTVATDYVGATGFMVDDTATDSADEGDIGIARMSADRRVLTDSNLQVANGDAPGGSGVVTANTQRVVLATDVALPAGTAKIGAVDTDADASVGAAVPTVGLAVAGTDGTNARLLKTDASGELQVDVLTMPSVTVDSEFPAAAVLADNTANPTTTVVGSMLHAFDGTTWDRVTNGGGTEASALRVTVASDSTGVLSVDDNAGSLTVDGTVTANAGTGTFIVDSELPAAAALADAASATPTTPTVGSVPLLMNATTIDRQRAVVNSLDSVGTGIAASGMVGQFDDTATSTVTENQFSTVRISTRRTLYVTPDSYAVDDSAMPATPNTMPVSGEYRSSATTYTDGDVTVLQANVRGAIKVDNDTALDADIDDVSTKPLQPSNVNTTALAASLVIKASSGRLIEVRGYNSATSSQFIQVHDASSLPADTAVPEEVITVPATSNFSIAFDSWKNFATGIVVCNSSTAATKTIGAADCWFSADYV